MAPALTVPQAQASTQHSIVDSFGYTQTQEPMTSHVSGRAPQATGLGQGQVDSFGYTSTQTAANVTP